MLRMVNIAATALLFGLSGIPTYVAADVAGRMDIVDGDTLHVSGKTVRIFGIDAPEAGQTCKTRDGTTWACGKWVSDTVRKAFQGKFARCVEIDRDRYDRIVARCDVNGTDMGRWLVQQGLAFAYRKYAMDYDLDEKGAAVNDRGLHASLVENPADFRAARVNGRTTGRVAPDATCAIKGNISSKGVRIYHMRGQEHYERTSISTAKGERWFCSEAEARAAGWRRAKR
ncbi:thermonuclease family protein [Lentibacter sp. XHP0401]|uniref:thermonuclease family protein n=1 Tax=Lentibacter sp. XHP0401 TaxID=2984334 RepID=UPI002981D58E|nr:thermonuclease family protein [Lentibacter sp. XHP0401]